MSDPSDRRVQTRAKVDIMVQIHLTDMREFMQEYASNLSTGGIFIRTKEPRPVDTMVYLQFRLKDGSRVIEGLGKVAHVNPPDHPEAGMGIEFINLDPESQKLLQKIVSEQT